eukprot:170100_1
MENPNNSSKKKTDQKHAYEEITSKIQTPIENPNNSSKKKTDQKHAYEEITSKIQTPMDNETKIAIGTKSKSKITNNIYITADEQKQSTKQIDEMISVNQIDEILDEIERRKEEKQDEPDVEWKQILKAFKTENINYIKNIITSKTVGINEQNPFDGKTLLIYATIVG